MDSDPDAVLGLNIYIYIYIITICVRLLIVLRSKFVIRLKHRVGNIGQ